MASKAKQKTRKEIRSIERLFAAQERDLPRTILDHRLIRSKIEDDFELITHTYAYKADDVNYYTMIQLYYFTDDHLWMATFDGDPQDMSGEQISSDLCGTETEAINEIEVLVINTLRRSLGEDVPLSSDEVVRAFLME